MRGGPRTFGQDLSCPVLLWILLTSREGFGYGALTPFGPAFQPVPLPSRGILRSPEPQLTLVWAPPLSLATTNGIDLSFFSSRYFDVSVPWVAPWALCIHAEVACMCRSGSPIRKSRDRSLRPAPPGLSQVVASFIIIRLQGIRRAPHQLPSILMDLPSSVLALLLLLADKIFVQILSRICPLLSQKEQWHSVFKEHAHAEAWPRGRPLRTGWDGLPDGCLPSSVFLFLRATALLALATFPSP